MKSHVKQFLNEYLAEMLEGNAAVFAGAGLSVPAGFVDWQELMRPLSEELELDIALESDLVAVAQFHVNANGRNRHKLHKALIDALSPNNPPTANHRLLAKLPIETYWTTNYDKLIEKALSDNDKIVDVKSAVPQLAITRQGRDATVYKMHGDVDRPDQAVATKDDYERYSTDRGAFVTALAGDLVSKTFLFLGFSFTDPNLDHVLSRVRLNFSENQRRHFAVLRTRQKLNSETNEAFNHHRVRQALFIEDLKRFNVKCLLIDEYSEITDFLTELVDRFRNRTVFVSASADDYSPWGRDAVIGFAQKLGQELIASGARVATGLGSGVGDAIFTGCVRTVLATKGLSIDEAVMVRPFPQAGSPAELGDLWEAYRNDILGQSGIALFLFGNKNVGDDTVIAEGVIREFEIARKHNVIVLPVGATGYAARELTDRVLADLGQFLPMDQDSLQMYLNLAGDEDNLDELVAPIVELIQKLRKP